MNTLCLFAYIAVIAVVLADATHSLHQTGSKAGDVVHWTTGSNSKGAATLNHTSAAFFKVTPVPTTVSPATSTTTPKAAVDAKTTDVAVTPVAAAAAVAKDNAETTTSGSTSSTAATTTTVAPVTTTAAGHTAKPNKK
ncbi:uncharacterized protein Dvir_GJ11804 [Drosophila virilis]|uniref:Uncharacterized protein n=1 Tax=Drosophila virilis TaxID=7244 RepID=B4LDN7_DROVI|nr:uncharacterized protein Dvir_GJ11804 [Drosophila virilis]